MGDKEQAEAPFSLKDGLTYFLNGVRHSKLLGMEIVEISESGLVVKLPYSEKIVGNPVTGVIHGGAITSLMDQSCGLAVAQALYPKIDITPTIDLRIDYMRPAEPKQDVFAYVSAYRKTKNVVFTRGVAYQDNPEEPIAHCVGNFMRMGLSKIPWKPQTDAPEAK
ncbi:MAG: PaaI family thioesterase [Pseudomonadales bacterium]|nr:PaaI family thioesterase [Pseudomonadales bacterium]